MYVAGSEAAAVRTAPEAARTAPAPSSSRATVQRIPACRQHTSPACKACVRSVQVALPLRRQSLQLRRQLCVAGKLVAPGGVHTVCLGKLVFLKDQQSGALFLADTGPTVSIIPGPTSSGGQALTTANSSIIATGAERTLQLALTLTVLVLILSRVKLMALSWALILCASSR